MVTWPAGQPEDHERAARSGDGGTVLRHLSRRPATLGWLIASSLGFAVLSAGLVFLRGRCHSTKPCLHGYAAVQGVGCAGDCAARAPANDLEYRNRFAEPSWNGRLPLVFRTSLGPVLLATVVALSLIALFAGKLLFDQNPTSSQPNPFFYGPIRVAIIYLLALGAAVPACVAMWVCYRRAERAGITELLRIRECLLAALTALGTLLSLGVFVTGAQRLAAQAAPKVAISFPAAYVLIFGFAFSALLLANFAPAYHRLTTAGKATIDTVLPIVTPPAENWQGRLQERKDLADLLKLSSGTRDVVTSAIVVAGPLISSAFSLFLPTGSG